MRLDFSSVSSDDSLSDVLANLGDLILLLMFLLDLLVLNVLSLLPLLSMLLIVAEGWSVSGDVHVLDNMWWWWRM